MLFLSLNARGYAMPRLQPLKTSTAGADQSIIITIGDRRLRTVAEATGLWDAESIIFNRGRSVTSWTFTGRVFHHAQRPVERAPA